jgi:hypothetical protein
MFVNMNAIAIVVLRVDASRVAEQAAQIDHPLEAYMVRPIVTRRHRPILRRGVPGRSRFELDPRRCPGLSCPQPTYLLQLSVQSIIPKPTAIFMAQKWKPIHWVDHAPDPSVAGLSSFRLAVFRCLHGLATPPMKYGPRLLQAGTIRFDHGW